MEQLRKHYYAFISHSSKDEKMAKWLLKQLENYHIPATIQKEYHAPKRLKPIFLFQKDLTGNKLRDALEGELRDSKFLIVVCSPASARSEYVNAEVQHFIDSGRYDKIIPFIIDGVPFASLSGQANEECFPPALISLKGTDRELRGIDLRESIKQRGSRQAAVVDIVASMLGVRFDTMWNRYRRYRRRQLIALTVAALMMVGAFVMLWKMMQPIDVSLSVDEATPVNSAFPPCQNIVVRMYLDDEQKTDTLASVGDTAWMHNIPRWYLGRDVRVELYTKEYLPVDTMLVLQRKMTLPICRDANIYGHVRFYLVDIAHPEQADIRVGGQKAQADADGLVEMDIPIEAQQKKYVVAVNNQTDTLYMPCGEDVVIALP
jgi:hypothetical protein